MTEVGGDDGDEMHWRNSSDVSEGERFPCIDCAFVGVATVACVVLEPGDEAWLPMAIP